MRSAVSRNCSLSNWRSSEAINLGVYLNQKLMAVVVVVVAGVVVVVVVAGVVVVVVVFNSNVQDPCSLHWLPKISNAPS